MKYLTHNFKKIACTFVLLILFAQMVVAEAPVEIVAQQDVTADENFLAVDDAFVVNSDIDGTTLNLIFDATPKYYLYKSRFKFWLEELSSQKAQQKFDDAVQAELIEGKHKDDPYFGPVQVYYGQLVVPIKFNLSKEQQVLAQQGKYKLVYQYQGCAEAGLCYPPQTKSLNLDAKLFSQAVVDQPIKKNAAISENVNNLSQNGSDLDSPSINTLDLESADGLASLLSNKGISSLLIFFVLGIFLAFTPCVLPMLPILSSILLANKNLSAARGGFLSLVYVIGMAITYALLGVVVAHFGAKANMQLYLQQPWVIISMAGLFIALALSMFGFFELKLPQFIQQHLTKANQKVQGGSVTGVLLMGIISALVVSPCVSAPLAGTLIYIGSTGDVVFGGLSLFFLALGMGVPLLLIGILGPKYLPQSGAWLNTSKFILAMLLVGVAVWLLARITPDIVDYILWASWSLGLAYFLGAFKEAQSKLGLVFKILGISLVLFAGVFLYKIYDTLTAQQLSTTNQHAIQLETVTTLDDLERLIEANSEQGFYSVVDLYAEWCVSCIVMEKEIFLQADVHARLSQVRFIKYDASDVGQETKKVFAKYNVEGLPNIMLFDAHNREVKNARIIGEVSKLKFLEDMQQFIK